MGRSLFGKRSEEINFMQDQEPKYSLFLQNDENIFSNKIKYLVTFCCIRRGLCAKRF